jgi:hypothetical protein
MAADPLHVQRGPGPFDGSRRFRGQGRRPQLWQRPDEVKMVVLPLVEGTQERRRLEMLSGTMHSFKRARLRDDGRRPSMGHIYHVRGPLPYFTIVNVA